MQKNLTYQIRSILFLSLKITSHFMTNMKVENGANFLVPQTRQYCSKVRICGMKVWLPVTFDCTVVVYNT